MKPALRYLIPVVLVVLAVSSCDCEDRLRKMVSNPGDRKEQVEKAKERRKESESSAPKEQEPNDFPNQATLFQLGGDLRPIEASIGSSDDVDWYSLTSRNGESWQVEVKVTPTSETLDPVIRVAVSGSKDDPIEYDVAGPGDAETIPILQASSAPQQIVISGKGGTAGAYEISFQKRLSGGAVEAEPNDDIEAATRFEAPGEIQGFYDRPKDRDVYFIPRKNLTGDAFQLEVSPVDDIVQQVRVYTHRDLETPYLTFQVPPSKAAGVPNLALPEDVLGVWVVLSAGESFSRDKSYRLKLLGHPPAEHALEAEPNDSVESAQRIELGAKLAGYFHVPEDVDHFRLFVDGIPADDAPDDGQAGEEQAGEEQAGAPGSEARQAPDAGGSAEQAGLEDAGDDQDATLAPMPPDPLEAVADKVAPKHVVRVTLSPRHEKGRVALAWKQEAQGGAQAPTVLASPEPGKPVTLCNRVVEQGFLDLEARPAEMPAEAMQSGYDYGLVAEDVSGQPGLEVEPNDTRDAADKLESAAARTGYIARPADTDVFAFAVPYPAPGADADAGQAPAAKPRTVEVVVSANPLNLGFELLDDEGGFVAEVNRAGAGAQEKLRIDLPPGLYFVHVSAKRGSSCKPYQISVDFID